MSPPAVSSNKKESGTARFLGAASSGILELLGFHPVDTVSKRLMNNPTKVFGDGKSFKESSKIMSQIIFKVPQIQFAVFFCLEFELTID